jgi:hypothetical protein
MSDFDSPWKEALDSYFPAFLKFFFSAIHDAIDWSRGHEMLDKELQQVVPAAEQGRRHVDKLVKVWRRDGEEAWVLIHIEVQSQAEEDFSRRMYIYNYRLFDRYNRAVASLAVLADDRADWRPTSFRSSLWGCNASLEFPVAKLLDYAAAEDALEKNANPFAIVVSAHVKALQTQQDAQGRYAWKLRLVRSLYERGLKPEEVRQLFRLIDWMMTLPQEQEQEFWLAMQRYEEEKKMPYVTSVERLAEQRGREQGMRKGLLKGLALGLELKFGAPGKKLMPRIRRIGDLDRLQSLHRLLRKVSRLDELRKELP